MKTPLLFYLSAARDLQRFAVGPALARGAERAGWGFECYYDDLRRGRHFGGGDPDASGWAGGSLVAGGRHAELVFWLASRYDLVALGDPQCLLWPVLDAVGAEALVRTSDPAELYGAAFARLDLPVPPRVLVLDGQGVGGVVAAPYLYPEFLSDGDALGVDVTSGEVMRRRIEGLGGKEFHGLYLDPDRADAFPHGLDSLESASPADTYATLTARLADRHADWGRGVLLGDPNLVAAQLPKARRLRLLPLYGRPQTDVVAKAESLIRKAREPIYGRQYDDRDFFVLGRLGHGLQVLDPEPPFDAAHAAPSAIPPPPLDPRELEPSDDELRGWAEEGRVLATLLVWSGMLRELHCLPRFVDLVAATGLRAGFLVTAETLEFSAGSPLPLLSVPVERGGVLGLAELVLASTGRAVAPEALLPPGALAASLAEAQEATAERLPDALVPRGWWALLDTPLVREPISRIGWRAQLGRASYLPKIRVASPDGPAATEDGSHPDGPREMTAVVRDAVRRSRLRQLFERKRPYDDFQPGDLDESVADAVSSSGFSYMWTKAGFGHPAIPHRRGDFVALPLTAGSWEGWTPFYAVSNAGQIVSAERRLLRSRRPGWLVGVIDSPLWALPGEILQYGSGLYEIAARVVGGGKSGRLVNVTPNVIARYARHLDDAGLIGRTSVSGR